MRKKAHLALADYCLNHIDTEHRILFPDYFRLGSLAPDLVPSFLTKPHTIDSTFDLLEKKLRLSITAGRIGGEFFGRIASKNLGIVTHYIADYFTYPHNSFYPGNLKDHCIYEKHQMRAFRKYSASHLFSNTTGIPPVSLPIRSAEDLLLFIRKNHALYASKAGNVETDCAFILSVTATVVQAVLALQSIPGHSISEEEAALAF